MIIGTAGHIDHGKTTLVAALTGVNTDRLPEERRRGVSIELGYAFMDGPQGLRIGFIDVPGHERLVHTMVSGATGMDMAMLLVAADDGVMPQTREHLAVLSLLGIRHGLVVVTKCDRADEARVAAVAAEVRGLMADSTLAGADVRCVSAHTGQGIDALREHLWQAAARLGPHRRVGDAFRLAVDRSFTLSGIGTVVTGTVHAGHVRVGDELVCVPGGRRMRVRSLHAQNREVTQALAGERCALGLAGVEREDIWRGQWLADPAVALETERLDARLTLWPGESHALRSGTQVHVHLGAEDVLASVAVLEPQVIEPGGSGMVQLVLRRPMGAWHGDRLIVRDASASRTLAGATVLDPFAPTRYRRTAARLAMLRALEATQPEQRLADALASSPQGIDLRRWQAAQGLLALPSGDHLPDVLRATEAQADMLLSAAEAANAEARVLQMLAAFHERHPDELGPDAGRLRRLALPRLPEPLWRALLARVREQGKVLLKGALVHLPEHGVRLSETEQRIAQKVAPALTGARYEGAWVRDLARAAAEPDALVRATLSRLGQRGDLHQVVRDLFYPPATMAELATLCRAVAEAHEGAVRAADYRDATGLGRKRAIQILEYFDRVGLLRRVGDTHHLRRDCQLFMEAGL
ncbi:MAG: selenocysteine-specific translation elongation factor [Hydrogenophaga sp.]|uniref:selenocysteine-specific translation elongation factor n=1 Tax=Hydrogenophaga sp. TaxID=1904254 RepID=UPI0026150700|nr:selenocysteine-specific translation elongation factor [Hydrogenophaga sp.]MDD3785798.1 selenocysteine-specific translation elongation factor [Hydrogenophaga sp.]